MLMQHLPFETMADDLAENGYAIVDHFLSTDHVLELLRGDEFKNHLLHFHQAGIGKHSEKQVNEAIRGDYIRWIDPRQTSGVIHLYISRLQEFMQHINQSLFLGLKDFEIHQTVYPIGTFYKRHLDQFRKDDHRKLSVICYLNQNWLEEHGGQLRIYLTHSHVDVLPMAGRLVCFRSDLLEHEVLPATRERLSITGWLLNQYADLKHLR
jgi:SM-20-related protein